MCESVSVRECMHMSERVIQDVRTVLLYVYIRTAGKFGGELKFDSCHGGTIIYDCVIACAHKYVSM